jgi:hypothetical protein
MRKDKHKLSDTEDVQSTKNHIKESSEMEEEGSVSECLEEESQGKGLIFEFQ